MEENFSFLQSLNKKDDDIEIVNVTDTSVEFITKDPEAITRSFQVVDQTPKPSTLLQDDYVDVDTRILQVVFSTNAALGYLIVVLGFIPFCFVQLIPQTWSQAYLLMGLGGAFLLTYVMMLMFRRILFLVLWMFVFLWVAGTGAALMKNIFPLQFGALIFIQSVAVLIYVGLAKRDPSTIKIVLLEYVLGIATWLVGIYAFVEQKDWLYGWIALAVVLLLPLYHYFQIEHKDRFSLDQQRLTDAVVHFYGDPVYLLVCKHR